MDPRDDYILSMIRACEQFCVSVNLREMGRGLRSVLVSLFSGCPHWVSRFFMVGPRREPEGGELSVFVKLSKGELILICAGKSVSDHKLLKEELFHG